MTRETKVGLGVAVSFLSLVGGVLGYKLYFEPNQSGAEDARQASKPSGPIKFGSAPKKFEPPTLDPKPADAPEVAKNDGKEPLAPPTPEAPPPITLTSTPPSVDPPSLAPPTLTPPPASEPPAPKPIEMSKPSEPPLSPPPLAPPTLSPVKEPSAEIPPPPMDPVKSVPTLEPTKAPSELDPPAVPVTKDPPTLEKKADPPPPPPPPSTAENPPRPMITIGTPVPAPNTFDRKYDAPLTPKTPVDPAPPSTPPSEIIRPMPKADHWQPVDPKPAATPAPGVPVTIKRQPDEAFAPAPLKGVPLVVPKADNAVRPAGSSSVEVRSFDYELYQPQPGDTFATISLAKYKSDRYHQALAQFNRERDPQMVAPQPGKPVLIPPVDYLESRYPLAIPSAGVSPPKPLSEGAAGSRYPTDHFTKEAASADWAKSGGEKQYRVQKNDTIWSIAKRTLGTGDRWPDILKLNRDTLRDVNQLSAGMVLRLPADAKVDGANLPQ